MIVELAVDGDEAEFPRVVCGGCETGAGGASGSAQLISISLDENLVDVAGRDERELVNVTQKINTTQRCSGDRRT